MAMILYNPTNEDMQTQYIGETVVIEGEKAAHFNENGEGRKPICRVRVDDPRGKHILNTLGPRGLMALEYGDEGDGEERKKKEGIERNLAFKRKQIINFNTQNEQQFQAHKPYISPTKQIQEYAKELGIGLREPYNVEDAAMKDIALLKKQLAEKIEEVEKKDTEMADLKKQMSELTSMVRQMMEAAGTAVKDKTEEPDTGATVDLRKMGKNNFADYLLANWNLIEKYPEDIKERFAKRFQVIYETEMPANKEELEKFVQKLAA